MNDDGWKQDRIGSAHRGENPMVMARLRTGFAVIGDTQHLPGYSVLLYERPDVRHLTELDADARRDFLFDMSLLGEAVSAACGPDLVVVNYEILGNALRVLHAHVHARYTWEPPDKVTGPVWRYPKATRYDPRHRYTDAAHGELRAAIARELRRLTASAYKR